MTVVAGTAKATPATTDLSFPEGVVGQVEIVVPDGCAGLVGFQLVYSGQPVIPRTAGQFIVANGEVIRWPLSNYPAGGRWACRAYNTDVFNHTLFFRFLVNEHNTVDTGVVMPVPITSTMDSQLLGA